jgi:hypothetical protein
VEGGRTREGVQKTGEILDRAGGNEKSRQGCSTAADYTMSHAQREKLMWNATRGWHILHHANRRFCFDVSEERERWAQRERRAYGQDNEKGAQNEREQGAHGNGVQTNTTRSAEKKTEEQDRPGLDTRTEPESRPEER